MQSPDDVIAMLDRAPGILIPLVREIPEANRKRRPVPQRWSAHEHFVHLAQVHPLFFQRLEVMLQGKRPRLVPYNPGKDNEDGALLAMDLEDAFARFERDRARLVALLRGLTPVQWELEAEHPEYSRYSIFIMFRHLAMHDFLHGYRIEELLLNRMW